MSDGRLGRRVSLIWGEVKPRGYYLCLIFNLISYICFLGDENLDEMIDEELILSGVNRKNEKAWASLYDHYYAALCAYVNRILKGSESTEDLVQEVFIAIWRSEKRFISIALQKIAKHPLLQPLSGSQWNQLCSASSGPNDFYEFS